MCVCVYIYTHPHVQNLLRPPNIDLQILFWSEQTQWMRTTLRKRHGNNYACTHIICICVGTITSKSVPHNIDLNSWVPLLRITLHQLSNLCGMRCSCLVRTCDGKFGQQFVTIRMIMKVKSAQCEGEWAILPETACASIRRLQNRLATYMCAGTWISGCEQENVSPARRE